MSGPRKTRKTSARPALPSAKKAQKAQKANEPGDSEGPPDDVVLVHSRTEDGEGVNVLRKRGDELSLGVVRPLEEGKAIHGDVVQLEAREEHPALFDVKTELSVPKKAPPHPGPSRVASKSYRTGWESLWGRRRRKSN